MQKFYQIAVVFAIASLLTHFKVTDNPYFTGLCAFLAAFILTVYIPAWLVWFRAGRPHLEGQDLMSAMAPLEAQYTRKAYDE